MFKIDASYLSPNVNMASRLEAATKQYGVPILVSGPLYNIFSDDIKLLCREVDTVTVKGSIQPVKLFTVDVDFEGLRPKKYKLIDMDIKEKRKINNIKKKKLLNSLFDNGSGRSLTTTWKVFQKDKDLKELRRHYDRSFTKKFDSAY